MTLKKSMKKNISFIAAVLVILIYFIFNGTIEIPVNQDTKPKVEDNFSDAGFKMHFIDVGQADSILIQQGDFNILVDGGNNDDSQLVIDYLKKNKVKKLDYVVGTHPHEDHIGGLDKVIEEFQIGKVYMPKVTANTKTFEDVLNAVKKKGLKITSPTPGSEFKLGDANCMILGPNGKEYEDLNDYSIVIKVTYKQTSFLLTGDAEGICEKEMLSKGFDISADLLKLGHHGSGSSTTKAFLDKVNPKYAIVSAAKGNDYGHPHKSTMDKLKSREIIVYRTDESGTIVCTSDGKNLKFNVKPGSYSYGNTKK